MDINLSEIGSTIAIGVYTLIGFDLFLYKNFEISFYKKFKDDFVKIGSIAQTSIFVILGFSVGMIAEDLSDKFSDDSALLFIDESSIRHNVVRKSDGRFSSLGENLYSSGLLHEHNLMTSTDARKVSNSLYYDAKNTVYREDNYFKELSAIQTRIDFSRSFAFVSLFFVLLFIFFIVLIKLIRFTRIEFLTDFVEHIRVQRSFKKSYHAILFFTFFWMLGVLAYFEEETEYDKRVYGYAYSLKTSGDYEKDLLTKSGITTTKYSDKSGNLIPSLSGVSMWDSDLHIAVADTKDGRSPRVFYVDVTEEENPKIYPADVDWREISEVPTDLEAVCAVNKRVWILESGHWEDKISGYKSPGKIIALKSKSISLTHSAEFKADFEVDLFPGAKDLEGLACWFDTKSKETHFLVAMRGDNSTNASIRTLTVKEPSSLLKLLGLDELEAKWGDPIELSRLNQLQSRRNNGEVRWVSGLSLQFSENNFYWVWASGAIEAKDGMEGVLYKLGEVKENTFTPYDSFNLCRSSEKNKTEGVALTKHRGEFILVSDNEDNGGDVEIWRNCKS